MGRCKILGQFLYRGWCLFTSGEVAEQIDTDGMFKQLDLFTMFSEQVGNIAMKQAEEKSVMPAGFVLPEQQIDDILRSGGGQG